MTLDIKANNVTGHSFEDIDAETRNAIIDEICKDCLSKADAESLARTLYYENDNDQAGHHIKYTVPRFTLDVYHEAKDNIVLRQKIENHKSIMTSKLTIPTSSKPNGNTFANLTQRIQQEVITILQDALFVPPNIATEIAESIFYGYDEETKNIRFELSLFFVVLSKLMMNSKKKSKAE